jgi:hypothetical protein
MAEVSLAAFIRSILKNILARITEKINTCSFPTWHESEPAMMPLEKLLYLKLKLLRKVSKKDVTHKPLLEKANGCTDKEAAAKNGRSKKQAICIRFQTLRKHRLKSDSNASFGFKPQKFQF